MAALPAVGFHHCSRWGKYWEDPRTWQAHRCFFLAMEGLRIEGYGQLWCVNQKASTVKEVWVSLVSPDLSWAFKEAIKPRTVCDSHTSLSNLNKPCNILSFLWSYISLPLPVASDPAAPSTVQPEIWHLLRVRNVGELTHVKTMAGHLRQRWGGELRVWQANTM